MSEQTAIQKDCNITWDHGWHIWRGLIEGERVINFDTLFRCSGAAGEPDE